MEEFTSPFADTSFLGFDETPSVPEKNVGVTSSESASKGMIKMPSMGERKQWTPLAITLVSLGGVLAVLLLSLLITYVVRLNTVKKTVKKYQEQFGNQWKKIAGSQPSAGMNQGTNSNSMTPKSAQSMSSRPNPASGSKSSSAGPSDKMPLDCVVDEECVGTECAPIDLRCLRYSEYKGLKKPQGAGQYRLPSERWVFSFPFENKMIRAGKFYLGGDENGLKYEASKFKIPEFQWDYAGHVLRNRLTGHVIEKVNDYELSLVPYEPSNPQQKWLFDGQRFYSIGALEEAHPKYYYIAFNPDKGSLFLKEGEEGDIYMRYANPSVAVEDYLAPYQFAETQ